MSKTIVRPSRDLRNNYADVVKAIKQDDKHVIITNNGVGELVLIGMDEYEEYEEFLHHRFIYNKLQESKARASDPNVTLHNADEVFAEFDQILEVQGL